MTVGIIYANLRKLTGTKELSIAGATVGVVVNEAVRQYPSMGNVILENGELRPHIIVTLKSQADDLAAQIANLRCEH